MRLAIPSLPALALAATAVLAAACSDSGGPGPLTPDSVAARYATSLPAAGASGDLGTLVLTTTEGSVSTDHVARGANIQLTLAANGTTSGTMHLPDVPDEDGGVVDFDADLTGTWTLANGMVTLSHAADTFLRDMPLTVRDGRLEGDRSFGNVRVRVTLVRQ